MSEDPFTTDVSRHVWNSRYRYREGATAYDRTVEDTWRRIARALAEVEREDRKGWEERFYGILKDFRFLPGGRIQAGAGTARQVTLFNCFVMGIVEDSMTSIFDNLKEGAITMQQGGGVGYDFSTLRPRGARAKGVGAIASGPISFMHIWDSMCATLLSTGARRGAMMATLRCEHPDIEEFITAKQEPGKLRHFNLSIQVTDAFMEAVRKDEDWALVFPAEALEGGGETLLKPWPGRRDPVPCVVLKRVPARTLWDKVMRATYDYAEPGVLFIDRINEANNLWYREHISATNPCGEIPLPPYGACDLGSVNLTRFVCDPFSEQARLDMEELRATVAVATRLLDDVIDASRFPLEEQREQAHGTRRVGLGITGLADTLIMLGFIYGEKESLAFARTVMREICHAAYRASVALAREKQSFPFFEREKYLQGPFIGSLPQDIRDDVSRYGIRNSHLTAIAPTGTISLLANNISNGLEPAFDFCYQRTLLNADGASSCFELSDYAWRLWRKLHESAPLPPAFVNAHELRAQAHLEIQAALQPYVDNSISKTINVPEDYPFEDFKELYALAYDMGLKGCTTFRPNPVTGEVLKGLEESADAPHCCTMEREAD